MSFSLSIEVWYDLICPWCLIGKRNLERALELFRHEAPQVKTQVAWRHYLLLPQVPAEGEPFQAFYEQRLGGPEAVAARRAQVREAGWASGVEFAFETIQRLPNTIAAHDLVDFAERTTGPAAAEALIERLFRAYFQEGVDIGDQDVLAAFAMDAGLDPEAWFAQGSMHDLLERLSVWARAADAARVAGVPYYLIDKRMPLSGAMPPETLLLALLEAARNGG